MGKPLNLHACALCERQIGTGWLMCAPHWRLVPRPLRDAVYHTWCNLQKVPPLAQKQYAARVRDDYFDARDAAIEAARAALGLPAGPPQAVRRTNTLFPHRNEGAAP